MFLFEIIFLVFSGLYYFLKRNFTAWTVVYNLGAQSLTPAVFLTDRNKFYYALLGFLVCALLVSLFMERIAWWIGWFILLPATYFVAESHGKSEGVNLYKRYLLQTSTVYDETKEEDKETLEFLKEELNMSRYQLLKKAKEKSKMYE